MCEIVKNILILFLLCHPNVQAEVYEAQNDNSCELKLDGNIRHLAINETWSSVVDPCIMYKCTPNLRIEKINQKCNTTCDSDHKYVPVPGECCGRCEATSCVDNVTKLKHKEGDVWKSFDNCTISECLRNENELIIESFKKSCPKLRNCPIENTEIRDCCQYCNRQERSPRQFTEIEFTNRDAYSSHPCLRTCVKGEQLTCNYEFIVEQYETMSKACYSCPQNKTDCYRPHCVTGDGMKRSIIVVNRMMPGPIIEVCVNDTIVVDVRNHLMSESTTIHWHGIHQKNTPYMDGVPHISQCPIQPGQTFRYTFLADNPGTHMWHSHLGLQRDDGLVGALIIRNFVDFHEQLYDFDLTEHIMLTNDWTHVPATAAFTAHHHGHGDNKPSNILINGRGKYFGKMTETEVETSTLQSFVQNPMANESTIPDASDDDDEFLSTTATDNLTTDKFNVIVHHALALHDRVKRELLPADADSPLIPYEIFNVNKGSRYRFRHINAGFLNCPIEISIDNHTITAISTDGNDIEPKEVTLLVTYAGERWDFIVNANQEVGNYFIRARGLMDCDERFTSSFQMAVVHYHGAKDEDPIDKPSYKLNRAGVTLNALNKGYGELDSITVAETKSTDNQPNFISKIEPDFKFFMSYDFYAKDNPLFHTAGLYGFNQVSFGQIYTPQINHITMKMPSSPAMLAKESLDSSFCNETSLLAQGVNCKETFCECTHVLQVPLNKVVEMILIDEGVTYDANHMFHLHGHYFHVVGMDRIRRNVTREEIKELDRLGKLRRRFTDSVRKDTVTVPDGGYTIIRFYTDNPGLWLMHCHIDFHAELGMAIIMKVGDYSQMPAVPIGFPTCQDYSVLNGDTTSGSNNLLHYYLMTLFLSIFAHICK